MMSSLYIWPNTRNSLAKSRNSWPNTRQVWNSEGSVIYQANGLCDEDEPSSSASAPFFRIWPRSRNIWPTTRKVWDSNGSLIHVPNGLCDEGETVSTVSRGVVKVETETSRVAAERICWVMSKQGRLEYLTLDGTKAAHVDGDRSFRMWYPVEVVSRKSSLETLSHCTPNVQATVGVKWDKLLPHQGVVNEVKMREQRLRNDIVLGPKSRHRLLDHIRKNYRQNLNKSYTVYYHDVDYAAESSRLRDALIKKIGEIRNGVKASNAISVSDGGTCELLPNGKSMSLIVDISKDEDLTQYCRFFCKNAVRSCRLEKSERRVLSNYFRSNRMETVKNPVLIQFATVEDCEEYLPRTFIVGSDRWNNVNNATMTFRVKWYKCPSSGVGVVKFNSANEAKMASDVFNCHGYAEVEKDIWFGDGTVAIKYIPNSYQHDYVFEYHIREILEANGIHIVSAYLQRITRYRNSLSVNVQQRIGRAITEYLIRHRQWDGGIPWLRVEWRALLSSNDLPWRWNILDVKDNEGIGDPCEAELIFENVQQGLDLVDFLTASTADFSTIAYEGYNVCQKVFIKPIYCVTVPVTKEVRVACDTLIRQIYDEQMLAAEVANHELESLEIVDLTWRNDDNVCDDCDKSVGEISVKGWPVCHAFKVTEVINVGPPRYLFYMRDILCFGVGLERLRNLRWSRLEFVDHVGVQFCGTVEQYGLLTNYLEEVDERLMTSSSSVNFSSKPTCPLCLCPVSNAFYCLECGHYYCLKCLIFQVKIMIRNRNLPMRCLSDGCEKLIAISDLKEIILGDERLPWLSAEKLRPLIDSGLDCIIREHANLRRCPTPECFGVFDISKKSGVLQCELCKKYRCCGCMLEPHDDLSCEMYSRLRIDGVASVNAYLRKNEGKVRVCPTKGCGAVIEKSGGCHHMQCIMCKMHFCWLCEFKSSQWKIHEHPGVNHGAVGAERPVNFDMHENHRRFSVRERRPGRLQEM